MHLDNGVGVLRLREEVMDASVMSILKDGNTAQDSSGTEI